MKRIISLIIIASLAFYGCEKDPVVPDNGENTEQGEGGNGSQEGGGQGQEGGSGEGGGQGEQGQGSQGGGQGDEGGTGQGEGGSGEGGQGGESGQSGEGGGSQTQTAITVYSENFDGSSSFTGYITYGNDWQSKSGDGSANVSYTGFNAAIRNDSYGSKGNNDTYDGASGAGYIRLTHQTGNNVFGYLIINGISTCGRSSFDMTLGVTQGKGQMAIEVSTDGSTWQALDYAFKGTYDYWEKTSCSFSVPAGTASFSVRLTLLAPYPDYKYGANVDDILITSGSGGSGSQGGEGGSGSGEGGGQTPAGVINRYVENPAPSTNSDYYSNTLYTHTVRSNQYVRNYSFCYDTRRHNPIWVAFPMHSIYAEGNGGRTDPQPWAQYPGLPVDKQSIIWDIENSGYQYWSYSSSQSQGFTWTKGHLCMSASRGGADTEMNIQTFYPVNIAPQIGSRAPRFADLWAKTENFHYHRGTQICSDTLYVVCGCYYGDPTWIEYDACDYNRHSQWSKACEMPTNQYKILLRTRSGSSGKRVQDCSASELKAIGFWFDSIMPDSASDELKDYAVSIAEIERRTGLSFFPAVTADIKSQCTPSDWGL